MVRLYKHWPHYRILQTTAGTYRSGYHPGAPDEYVTVIGPGDQTKRVPTPALGDWQLAAEDGVVVVYYKRLDGDWSEEVRVPTTIACGQPVGALVTGGTGPIGPAGATGAQGEQGPEGPDGRDAEVDDATIDRIAAAVVGRLFSEAPPDDHYGLPEYARFGTKLQDYIAVMVHAGFMTHVLATTDEAAAGMLASGYVPKVK